MSTDHQRYSIENQKAAIREYAAIYGLTIVRSFDDVGKSGLTLKGRPGLTALLKEVMEGSAAFEVLLVYDVSRWGRFQDIDEGAHYEFICRRAGLKVIYVAERFETDPNGMGSVLKSLRRVMASEYSRDLSAKVFFAQCRTARRGYWTSGAPGIGLRRQLLDDQGRPKAILQKGERKAIQGEKIVLVPGPPEEVGIIREIFDRYVNREQRLPAIAAALNEPSHPASQLQHWWPATLGHMLRNHKYVGHIVFGKKSTKLKGKLRWNPPDEWVVVENAFEAIVDPLVFERAQARLAKNRPTNRLLLDHLQALWAEHGTLTAPLISKSPGHGIQIYRERFGGLPSAYDLIGYDYRRLNFPFSRRRQTTLSLKQGILAEIEERLERICVGRGGHVFALPDGDRVALRTMLGFRRPSGTVEWRLKLNWARGATKIIFVRISEDGSTIHDCMLLARAEYGGRHLTTLLEPPEAMRGHVFQSLDELLKVGLAAPASSAPPTKRQRDLDQGAKRSHQRNPRKGGDLRPVVNRGDA